MSLYSATLGGYRKAKSAITTARYKENEKKLVRIK